MEKLPHTDQRHDDQMKTGDAVTLPRNVFALWGKVGEAGTKLIVFGMPTAKTSTILSATTAVISGYGRPRPGKNGRILFGSCRGEAEPLPRRTTSHVPYYSDYTRRVGEMRSPIFGKRDMARASSYVHSRLSRDYLLLRNNFLQ
jgi:hypothetical protein